jgi:hypothetical protein
MFGKDTILADLALIKSFPKYEEVNELELQVRLCKILGLAFALSITGVAGVGSLFALVQGLRVRRVIKQHRGRFGGILLAWWCIVVGALGVLLLPPAIAFTVWK